MQRPPPAGARRLDASRRRAHSCGAAVATPDLAGTGTQISTIIPQVQLPPDGHFNYTISAIVATGGVATGEVVYCIKATGRTNAAVAGGIVLYSSVATTAAGWDGHINRTAYVNGKTDLTGA